VDIQVGFGVIVSVHAADSLCAAFPPLSSSVSGLRLRLRVRVMSGDMLDAGLVNGDAMMGVRGRAERGGNRVERARLGDEIACKDDEPPVSAAMCSGETKSGL